MALTSSRSWQRVHFSGGAELPGGVAVEDGGVGVGELRGPVGASTRAFFAGSGPLVVVPASGGDVVSVTLGNRPTDDFEVADALIGTPTLAPTIDASNE